MQFYTTDQIPAELARRSFTAGLMKIGPNGGAPLFGLTGLAKELMCKDTVHAYWTKELQFPSVTLNGAIASAATTTFTVVSTAQVKVGSLLRVRVVGESAHEIIEVITITNTTTLEVARGVAGTTAKAAIPDATVLIEIGTAYEQASEKPESRVILPARHTNNTQIFRDGWDVSGTLASVQMEVGDGAVLENKEDAMFFHGQSIEKALFFSVASVGTKNGKPRTTMDGIESTISKYAPTNLIEAGATTTFSQLESYLNPLFDKAVNGRMGNMRTLFVGGHAMSVINNIGIKSGQYNIEYGQTGFGLQFASFKTSRGTFEMIEHPLFNTNEEWKKMAVAMDLSNFDIRYLRKTFNKEYNDSGRDAMGGVFTTELTMELRNPFSCGIIYDLTAAAA